MPRLVGGATVSVLLDVMVQPDSSMVACACVVCVCVCVFVCVCVRACVCGVSLLHLQAAKVSVESQLQGAKENAEHFKALSLSNERITQASRTFRALCHHCSATGICE